MSIVDSAYAQIIQQLGIATHDSTERIDSDAECENREYDAHESDDLYLTMLVTNISDPPYEAERREEEADCIYE